MKIKRKRFILLFILFLLFLVFAFYEKDKIKKQYDSAIVCIENKQYTEAINKLRNLLDYKDGEQLMQQASDGKKYEESMILIQKKQYEDAITKLMEIPDFEDSKEQIQLAKYNLAIQYFDNKDYDTSKQLFNELNGYECSEKYLDEISREQLIQLTEHTYNKACNFLENKEYEKSLENFNLILGYEDSNKKAESCKRFILAHNVSGGVLNSFGITKDGKVLVAGDNSYNQGNVDLWENIVSIDGYGEYTIGLTEQGTVNVAGNLSEVHQDFVSTWEHIIDVASGDLYVVALKNNGTVVATGHNGDGQCNVEDWKDIVDIDAGWRFTVGLTQDGELLFTGKIPDDMEKGYLNTKDKWKDVVKIAASGGDPIHDDRGKGHVVGLTSNGHVIAIGDNSKGQCNIEDWENIIAIAAGDWYTVALTDEGKVLITGENEKGSKYIEQEKIDNWEKIQEIAAGYGQTLVVKNDRFVDVMGFDDYSKGSDVIDWAEEIRK